MELVKTAEKDKNIGMVSSKAYFKEGTIQNAGLSFEKALQINRVGGISIGYGLKDNNSNLKREIEIFAPGGVAPLYKRKMLEEIFKQDKEFFDEDFFAYAEDLDLGFRGRLLGWNCFLSPNAKLIHLHSQTGISASPFKAFFSERNTILTAIKNLPTIKLINFLFNNLRLKFSYFYKKNESVDKLNKNIGLLNIIFIMFKVYFSILFYLIKMLIKRYKIQANRRVNNKEIRNWFKIFNRGEVENEE